MPDLLRANHNGIPVIWCDIDVPLTGTLTFGVGMRDEPAHLAGITHLAEHLIFRAMGDITPLHDGVTSSGTVAFSATGTPDEVAGFLNKLAEVILSPSLTEQDIQRERQVIEAESPERFGPSAGLLTFRYGLEGVGKSHAGVPTIASISVDEVQGWIGEWFVSGNARLGFTSQPPPGLEVRLPEGQVPPHRGERRILSAPTLVPSYKSGVALSLLVDEHLSPFLRDALDAELITALRTTSGLIYSIESETTPTEPGIDQIDLVLDPLEEEVAEVVERAVAVIRRVAHDGFSPHSIASAKSVCLALLGHPSAWCSYVDQVITAELVGGVAASPHEWMASCRSIDSATLEASLRGGLDTLIVAYDQDAELRDGLADELELAVDEPELMNVVDAPRRGPGRNWRGNWFSINDWVRLDDAVLYEHIFGETRSVLLDDVAVAGRFTDGSLALIDGRGRDHVIHPILWRHGSELIEAILERIPEPRRRDFSWHDRERPRSGAIA